MRVLILGGTGEAASLAERLAARPAFDVVLSLAGRTAVPRPVPVATRSGGFGGAEGLARFLRDEGIAAVVRATHPFAARIARNAAEACREAGIPLLAVERPAWTREAGDDWREVADMAAAVRALGETPRRVFLTIGRQDLSAFAAAPQHAYLARMVEAPDAAPPDTRLILARGPFDAGAERALMETERIEVVVAKNAGGAATYGKITAARSLGLPVVMVARPMLPTGETAGSVEEAVAWLERAHAGTLRGV